MRVQCEICNQEFSEFTIRRHQKMCQQYNQYVKKDVREHSRSGKHRETFSCILCDKELISQRGVFVHLSTMHFKNGWTCKKSQETKVVNPAICVKCEKCGQRFIERKTKPNSSKLCKICCSSENRENPESFDTNEEVIDVPSEDNDSSDDNLDYLDGNFYMLNTLTHQILKL